MREIKFMAWDIDSKVWVDDVLITANKYGFLYRNYNRCEFMGEDRNIILCQFTGLKDKNGREIYEGYIVNMEFGKAVVFFQDGSFKIRFDTDQDLLSNYCGGINDKTEVIGNIYENSELVSAIDIEST